MLASCVGGTAFDSRSRLLFVACVASCKSRTWGTALSGLLAVGESELDLPSLTPSSVAGCGRLQLAAAKLSNFSINTTEVSKWAAPSCS